MSSWGVVRNLGGPPAPGLGCDPDPIYGHSAEPSADGDAHSSNYDGARGVLFSADEDFRKNSGSGTEKGFGYLRVCNYANLAGPVQIGQFRTTRGRLLRATQRQRPGQPVPARLTNATQVWGVAVDEATGLIYLSDMNSGLWIVRRTDR